MTVGQVLTTMTSVEISEWMAFDNLKDEGYMDKIVSKSMTQQQRNEAIKTMFGG